MAALKYDPVTYDRVRGEWGFWDETQVYWHGPYDSEAQARKALNEYCMKVLGWDTDA